MYGKLAIIVYAFDSSQDPTKNCIRRAMRGPRLRVPPSNTERSDQLGNDGSERHEW
jgi:hypothetical protein